MTTTLEAPETITVESELDLHADAMPVIKTSATSSKPAAAPAQPDESIRPSKDWFSGWCNGFARGGECTDGKRTNKVGEPIVNCLYEGINGDKAPHKVLFCACSCHDVHRDPEDPNLGIVRTEKDTAARQAKTAAARKKATDAAALADATAAAEDAAS